MGESLWQTLRLEGARVSWWRNGAEARAGLVGEMPDAVICDIRLPDTSGADLFMDVAKRRALPPFLFMTAYGQIDDAVRLLRAGACDYITKPFDTENFLDRVRALMPPSVNDAETAGALGRSSAMQRIEALLRRIADLPSPVLLGGPTGCGKEVAAAYLHAVSKRNSQLFVAVNCAALPADLIESELFGHERGAFTGAQTQHKGFAERAQDGILFLDEIGELPLRLQAKLLRLIEQRTFTRLGGERQVPFQARIVCASNRDLATASATGAFRDDLYHRINTIEIVIPPLTERREDIEGLLHHFFDGFAQDESALRGFASTTIEMALDHDWPGNCREVRNRVERAVALATGEWIMPWDLFPDVAPDEPATGSQGFAKLADVRARAERRQIERALTETGGGVAEAAELLGISRTTLWEKMKRLNIAVNQ